MAVGVSFLVIGLVVAIVLIVLYVLNHSTFKNNTIRKLRLTHHSLSSVGTAATTRYPDHCIVFVGIARDSRKSLEYLTSDVFERWGAMFGKGWQGMFLENGSMDGTREMLQSHPKIMVVGGDGEAAAKFASTFPVGKPRKATGARRIARMSHLRNQLQEEIEDRYLHETKTVKIVCMIDTDMFFVDDEQQVVASMDMLMTQKTRLVSAISGYTKIVTDDSLSFRTKLYDTYAYEDEYTLNALEYNDHAFSKAKTSYIANHISPQDVTWPKHVASCFGGACLYACTPRFLANRFTVEYVPEMMNKRVYCEHVGFQRRLGGNIMIGFNMFSPNK